MLFGILWPLPLQSSHSWDGVLQRGDSARQLPDVNQVGERSLLFCQFIDWLVVWLCIALFACWLVGGFFVCLLVGC